MLKTPTSPTSTRTLGFQCLAVGKFTSVLVDSIYWVGVWLVAARAADPVSFAWLASLAAIVYLFPFAFFSLLGGVLAEKFGAGTIVFAGRVVELPVIAFGVFGLASAAGEASWPLWVQFATLAMLGARAAVVSPARYALLPDILADRYLAPGNGRLERAGFWGMMAGCLGASLLVGEIAAENPFAYLFLPLLSVVGILTTWYVPRPPATRPSEPLVSGLDPYRFLTNGRLLLSEPRLFAACLGLSVFWGMMLVFVLNAVHFGATTLGLSQQVAWIAALLAALCAGLGLGAYVAGWLSVGTVELGLVPIGSAGWLIASIGLFFSSGFAAAAALLFFAGFCAGGFLVPLNAFLQKYSPSGQRGDCLATANVASAGAMLIGCLVASFGSTLLGLGAPSIFLVAGLSLAILTYALIRTIPDFFVRTVVFLLTRTIYRIRVVGRENLPEQGPAVLVMNHTSYADGNLIVSVIPRFIRFVVYRGHYEHPFLRWLGETFHAIPVDAEAPPKEIIKALRQASGALKQGELVGIFAEGSITRTGFLLPFQRGLELILRHAPDVPIIPGYIDGMWGSIFSYQGGKFFWKLPRKLPYPVTIKFGKPMPASSSAFEVREQVQLLGVDCFELRKSRRKPLHRQFIHKAKRYARRPCIADAMTPMMTYGQTLMRAVIFARLLQRELGTERNVGVFVPPSAGAALSNIALSFLGKAPVNLNYTTGNDVLDNCIRQAGIRHVLTSKRFLDRVPLRPGAELILLEELRNKVTTADKLVGLAARFLPAWFTEHVILGLGGHHADELATIVFSSGSTGTPKGIMLTHHNVGANIEQVTQMVDATHDDRVLGILPVFHSFGYTVTFWLPLMIGASTVYHVSPLEAEMVGKLCREFQLTIGVSTATFLRNYIRKCEKEDFASLRLLVCGAEKLPTQLAEQFEQTFGIRPLEGYGCTELSPVVAANRPDVVIGNYRQIGNKPGSIGHPMPGLAVRIVHPETWEPLPVGEDGMLIVKGPNVMKGYLNNPEMTAEVIRDGWYATGDIVKLDDDGFLTITDRVSRFSKIAGEMVPHGKVEEIIHETLETTDRVCAVVGVPDAKKGERLVVLHTHLPMPVDQLWERLKEKGLPPLWLPGKQSFYEVSELPLLGTGKIDLKKIKTMAMERTSTKSAS